MSTQSPPIDHTMGVWEQYTNSIASARIPVCMPGSYMPQIFFSVGNISVFQNIAMAVLFGENIASTVLFSENIARTIIFIENIARAVLFSLLFKFQLVENFFACRLVTIFDVWSTNLESRGSTSSFFLFCKHAKQCNEMNQAWEKLIEVEHYRDTWNIRDKHCSFVIHWEKEALKTIMMTGHISSKVGRVRLRKSMLDR